MSAVQRVSFGVKKPISPHLDQCISEIGMNKDRIKIIEVYVEILFKTIPYGSSRPATLVHQVVVRKYTIVSKQRGV